MSKKGSGGDWIGIILCLWFCWPVGLFLLYRKLKKESRRLRDSRDRKYLAIIGDRLTMNVESIARAIPTGVGRACHEIQSMIDRGLLGKHAYIDMDSRRLILDNRLHQTVESEFVPEEEVRRREEEAAAAVAAAEEAKREAEKQKNHSNERDEFDAKLRELRRLNDDIENEAVSADIYRIEMLTGSIFTAVHGNPEKREKIQTFMNYYLPTTIKLLGAYAHLEDQPMSVPNVAQARADIEKTIKRLVECFEQLLDRLYKSDVIDISSDIRVLEAMMAKDGMDGKYSFKK